MPFDVSSIFTDELAKHRSSMLPKLIRVDVEQLVENDANFYTVDAAALEELKNSIALSGIMDPPTVCSIEGGRYRLISGHRRTAAVRALVAEGRDDLRSMPVLVRSPQSAAMEELELIMANSTARVLSSAEISKAAQRVERLLYDLKEQGVEFPGRMRDHVADACNISRTKLANLHTIETHLLADFHAAWTAGKLPDSAALELAKMEPEDQSRLCTALGVDKDYPTAKQLERLRQMFAAGHRFQPSCTCPDGSSCSAGRGNAMIRAAAYATPYEEACTGSGCCLTCKRGPTADAYFRCSNMCSKGKDQVKEKNDAVKAEAAKAREARLAGKKAEIQKFAARIATAARLAGCDEYLLIGRIQRTRQSIEKIAAGDFGSEYVYPGMLDPTFDEIPDLCKVLKCSADYLCGLSDDLGG